MSAAPSGRSLRHPLNAAHGEVTRLAKLADRGESAETPAVLISGVALVLVPFVSIIIALAFAVGHVTRESPSPPATAPASTQRVSLPREPQPFFQKRKEAVVEDFWTIVAYVVLIGLALVPLAVLAFLWREAGRRRTT